MTLKGRVRDILNAQCEAAAMKEAAWTSEKRPEVVVDDSIGRLIRTLKGMVSKKRFAPVHPGSKQRPRGDSDDDGDNDDDDDDEDGKASSTARKRRSSYTTDQHDMSTTAEHAVASASIESGLPTNFYETDEFLKAEASGRPLYPLFKNFAIPVMAWFKEGVRVVVCCLDKGTVKAKARMAKQRAAEAKKAKLFPYPDEVCMTAGGALYNEKKRSPDGRFAYVPMDYERLVLTRRLRNQAFEWFAHAFAAHVFPTDGTLYMDYADETGKVPIVMEIKTGTIKERHDLVNSYGEGDVAILNWLTYFSDKNAMVCAIDGDMFGILTHYLSNRPANAGKKLESGPVLYWSDHKVYRNMNVFLMCLRELRVHPLVIALLCIFPGNDFFMSEDKKRMLNLINIDTIWEGLKAVPWNTYSEFGTWLDTLHSKHKQPSLSSKTPSQPSSSKSGANAELKTRALTFVREVQRSIIAHKPARKTKTPAKASAKKSNRKSSAKIAKPSKGQEDATRALSDIVVGNLEYWYYGHSLINPEEFTAIVGLEWRALRQTRSDLDREELADLAHVKLDN